MIDLKKYDAIIFDLGGVVLNIDYQKTISAFQQLGLAEFDGMYGKMHQSGLFDQLETGKIAPDEFLETLLQQLPGATLEQVHAAWNAMLLDFPPARMELLARIRQGRRTYLLSNTNAIHLREFTASLHAQTGYGSLHDLFDKVFLSHQIGLRKPHVEVFHYVMKEEGLDPEKTLFIDDSPQHVEGAKKAGLHAYHLQFPETIEGLFEA